MYHAFRGTSMSRSALAVLRSLASFAFLAAACSMFAATTPAPIPRLDLRTGWQLQSDCVIKGSTAGPVGLKNNGAPELDGEILSSPLYHPIQWIPATVPTTIVAAQVAAGSI